MLLEASNKKETLEISTLDNLKKDFDVLREKLNELRNKFSHIMNEELDENCEDIELEINTLKKAVNKYVYWKHQYNKSRKKLEQIGRKVKHENDGENDEEYDSWDSPPGSNEEYDWEYIRQLNFEIQQNGYR